MNTNNKNFGQLPKKDLGASSNHAWPKDNGFGVNFEEKTTRAEQAVTWGCYCTMIYASVVAFMPQTAAAAARVFLG